MGDWLLALVIAVGYRDLVGDKRYMQSYKFGDVYQPICITQFPELGECMFMSEDTFKIGLGQYKIIRFMRKLTSIEYRDIFRVSDGPDLWLGCCSREKPEMFEPMPLIYMEPTCRAHLNVLADTIRFNHLQDQPIEFFTNFFIEVSEKELEAHFNQLFATS